jgi:hypothetical protein
MREILEQVYADVFLDGINQKAIKDLLLLGEYDCVTLNNEKFWKNRECDPMVMCL